MWVNWVLLQKIFFCIAVPASVLLVVQIILMLVGFGSGGGDVDTDVGVDVDGDMDFDGSSAGEEVLDADHGFGVFTIRGLIAFFAVGGWVGYTLADGNAVLAISMALLSGTIALILMGLLLKWLMTLQSNGNIKYKDAIGLNAEVYLTIPKKDGGKGKINVCLSERLIEASAIQLGEEPIATGKQVKIVNIINDTFVVEPLD